MLWFPSAIFPTCTPTFRWWTDQNEHAVYHDFIFFFVICSFYCDISKTPDTRKNIFDNLWNWLKSHSLFISYWEVIQAFKHSIRLHSFIRSFVCSFDSPIHGMWKSALGTSVMTCVEKEASDRNSTFHYIGFWWKFPSKMLAKRKLLTCRKR